ncbi:hypothetical protein B0H13DRAFT_1956473 [Mycena leptocephala]|nr:hypothetical protein B0H13DRAFT_1956473 [Mycena leptocephala]
MNSALDNSPLLFRVSAAVKSRFTTPRLSTTVSLPRLHSAQGWEEIEGSESARRTFEELGLDFLEAIASKAAVRYLLPSPYGSIAAYDNVVKILLSDSTLALIYNAIPKYAPTSTAPTPNKDAATFLKIYTGLYIVNATHGTRGMRPWWAFILDILADAAVKGLNPRTNIIPRELKAGVVKSKSKSRASKTRTKGDIRRESKIQSPLDTHSNVSLASPAIPPRVLAERTNALGTPAVTPSATNEDGTPAKKKHKTTKEPKPTPASFPAPLMYTTPTPTTQIASGSRA